MATWFYHRTLPPRLVSGGSPPGEGWADTPAAFYEAVPKGPLAVVVVDRSLDPVTEMARPSHEPVAPPKRLGRPPLNKKK